jgi:very-short-patch-repair endonuclease
MATISSELADVVSRRHGIITHDQLLQDGVSRHSVRRLVTSGLLVVEHKHVYRLATAPDTFESRCAAACAADSGALVGGVAAARLWRFRHVWQPDVPHILVAHDRTPITKGVVLRRSNVLSTDEVVQRDDGIAVAAPPRAWFDCARDLDDERFERLTEWVLDQHATLPTLWGTAQRLQARGRPGLARVKRVMSRRADWQKPADSGLELRVLTALEARGIVLVRQLPIVLPNGITIHPDGADPTIRWALEIDHVTWHGGRLDAQRDKTRDRQARLLGWEVERVTDQELAEDFHGTIDQIVVLYRRRHATFVAA